MATDAGSKPVPMFAQAHLERRFTGQWQLDRRIDDRLNGRSGTFRGTAELLPRPGGLTYLEQGDLQIGNADPLKAGRTYLWRFQSAVIDVFFADGRFFHSFDPAQARMRAEHACDPDHYVVDYQFVSEGEWRQSWTVVGPRKNYRLENRFWR
jgi:hypothetical protein